MTPRLSLSKSPAKLKNTSLSTVSPSPIFTNCVPSTYANSTPSQSWPKNDGFNRHPRLVEDLLESERPRSRRPECNRRDRGSQFSPTTVIDTNEAIAYNSYYEQASKREPRYLDRGNLLHE